MGFVFVWKRTLCPFSLSCKAVFHSAHSQLSSASTTQSFYLCYLTNYVSVLYLYTYFCCIAKVLKEYAYCIPNVIILITMGLEKYSLAFRKISSLTFCISLQAFEVDQILMSTHISKGQTSWMLSVLPDTVMRLLNGKIQNSFISGSGMNFYYLLHHLSQPQQITRTNHGSVSVA